MLLEITDQRAKDALIDFIDELDASIYSDANILAMLSSFCRSCAKYGVAAVVVLKCSVRGGRSREA